LLNSVLVLWSVSRPFSDTKPSAFTKLILTYLNPICIAPHSFHFFTLLCGLVSLTYHRHPIIFFPFPALLRDN
jgi:hypothetical protein